MAGPIAFGADIKSGIKITKISHYRDPTFLKPTFAQARDIVVIETNAGISGIGEGGSKEMIQNCAEMLIGEDSTWLFGISRESFSRRLSMNYWAV